MFCTIWNFSNLLYFILWCGPYAKMFKNTSCCPQFEVPQMSKYHKHTMFPTIWNFRNLLYFIFWCGSRVNMIENIPCFPQFEVPQMSKYHKHTMLSTIWGSSNQGMLETWYVFHHLRFWDLGLYNIKRVESRAGKPYFRGPITVNAASVSLCTQRIGHYRILVRPLLPSLGSHYADPPRPTPHSNNAYVLIADPALLSKPHPNCLPACSLSLCSTLGRPGP